MKNTSMLKAVLWIVAGADALALLFVGWVYPEVPTAIYTLTGVLLVCLAALAKVNGSISFIPRFCGPFRLWHPLLRGCRLG